MHIYLDEDSIDQRLVQLLRRAGHDVEIPADAGLSGKDDPTQLAYAITSGRICLTSNHGDSKIPCTFSTFGDKLRSRAMGGERQRDTQLRSADAARRKYAAPFDRKRHSNNCKIGRWIVESEG